MYLSIFHTFRIWANQKCPIKYITTKIFLIDEGLKIFGPKFWKKKNKIILLSNYVQIMKTPNLHHSMNLISPSKSKFFIAYFCLNWHKKPHKLCKIMHTLDVLLLRTFYVELESFSLLGHTVKNKCRKKCKSSKMESILVLLPAF